MEEPVIVPENKFTLCVRTEVVKDNPEGFETPSEDILPVKVPFPENIWGIDVPMKFNLELVVVVSELNTAPLLVMLPSFWRVAWLTSKVAPFSMIVFPFTITPPALPLPTSNVPALIIKLPLIWRTPEVTALNLPVPVLFTVRFPCIVLEFEVNALSVPVDNVVLTIKFPKLVELDVKLVPVVFPFNVAVAFGCQVAAGI